MRSANPSANPGVNPLTALVLAGCAWLVVLAWDQVWVSAGVLLVALAVAPRSGRQPGRRLRAWVTTALVVAPVAASFVVIHVPHGVAEVAPLVTLDGLATAGELTLRFAALMAAVIAGVAQASIPELAKALQVGAGKAGGPVAGKLAYLVGASLRLLPESRAVITRVREANQLAGRRVRGWRVVPAVAVPVIVHLLGQGARRAHALESAGLGLPGRRTVMEPPADSRAQWWIRRAAPLAAVGIAAVGLAW